MKRTGSILLGEDDGGRLDNLPPPEKEKLKMGDVERVNLEHWQRASPKYIIMRTVVIGTNINFLLALWFVRANASECTRHCCLQEKEKREWFDLEKKNCCTDLPWGGSTILYSLATNHGTPTTSIVSTAPNGHSTPTTKESATFDGHWSTSHHGRCNRAISFTFEQPIVQ